MLNERLKLLRTEKNITQKTLSVDMHVSPSAIARYESGDMYPDYDKLQWLCDYFNVSADYLLGFSDIRLPYTNSLNMHLSKDLQELLNYYNELSRESQIIAKGKIVELYREENAKGKKQNRKQTG